KYSISFWAFDPEPEAKIAMRFFTFSFLKLIVVFDYFRLYPNLMLFLIYGTSTMCKNSIFACDYCYISRNKPHDACLTVQLFPLDSFVVILKVCYLKLYFIDIISVYRLIF